MFAGSGNAQSVIRNVASVEWGTITQRFSLASNPVDIEVEDVMPARQEVGFFKLADGAANSLQFRLEAISCVAASPFVSAPLRDGAYQIDENIPVAAVSASSIGIGEPLLIVLQTSDPNANRRDTLEIDIVSNSGDRERLVLTETGTNTGRFSGFVRTAPSISTPIQNDCVINASADQHQRFTINNIDGTEISTLEIDMIAAPNATVFDFESGTAVNGVRITLVNADTGAQAQVYGLDALASFPATIVSGENVTDSSGRLYQSGQGQYLFPLVRPGRYRLVVEPPPPFNSIATFNPANPAGVRVLSGNSFSGTGGFSGEPFVINTVGPVGFNIPLTRATNAIRIVKKASRQVASPGDPVMFRIELANAEHNRRTLAFQLRDELPSQLRLQVNSIRLNGEPVADNAIIAADGRNFSLELGSLGPNERAVVSYLTEVMPQAREGVAVNRATVILDANSQGAIAEASVRIVRENISNRMTIVGQITEGGCAVNPRRARGVAGVRVMLEDGSYAVTDEDGRYHFEALRPGLHVVQLDESSLPLDLAAVDCAQNTRSAGRAFSRFVEGYGGALKRVDFRVRSVKPRHNKGPVRPSEIFKPAISDAQAAGSERNWLEGLSNGIDWIFPEPDHNPRTRVIRVAIKHLPGQRVDLRINGALAPQVSFDGVKVSENGEMAVSSWRGLGITLHSNRLEASVITKDGQVVKVLTREVYFANAPMRAEIVREKSLLVADGITRPLIAVRLTDRNGRPVHHGLTGDFTVPTSYQAAIEADAQQARQLAGLERGRPVWRVVGDEGLAYIELQPTTLSGAISIDFPFRDGEVRRNVSVETWLEPGDRPWTIVGFAAGSVGFNHLSDNLEDISEEDKTDYTDARLALYARGRVTGKWLMTLAYDSDKKRDETRFRGVIDPDQYYTIYADRSERRYDAASLRHLYLRLERPQFYAMFGDFETAINDPQLARYNRSLTGVRTEFRNERVSATAFVADTPHRFGRVEIQGNGLTGPYTIGITDILQNSERVTIEVRDRFRSNLLIAQKSLSRHIDYDIDYFTGTLRFREPILSRDSDLNPRFVVIDYETASDTQFTVQAGGRVTWSTGDQKLRIGATVLRDDDAVRQTILAGADIRWRPFESTELRAEIAASDADPASGAASHIEDAAIATAWLIEAEHHSKQFDFLAYAREQQAEFGVGQLNGAERGSRKFGLDGRTRVNDNLSIAASGWHEELMLSDTSRIAGRTLLEYRSKNTDGRIGLVYARDQVTDGTLRQSTLAQLGMTQRLFGDRLELDGQSELALDNAESVDFPARHRLTARYRALDWATLVGTYELSSGDNFDAQTYIAGVELEPWAGARIGLTGNHQKIDEFGPRTYAAYGFAQSIVLDEHWSLDASLDGNKTLSGEIDPNDIVNPLHPVASGGFLTSGHSTAFTEDFAAVSTGVTYRQASWSAAMRAEYRDGSLNDQYGLTASVLRKIGEGSAVGGAFSWLHAERTDGPATELASIALSWAHRPSGSRWSWLEKIELRDDRVTGAVAGQRGPIGSSVLLVDGNQHSRRIVNSLSVNYSPSSPQSESQAQPQWLDRSELTVFFGTRYVSEQFGQDDIKGWSSIVAGDFRFDLSKHVDVGASASIRKSNGGRAWHYSAGPNIGVSPVENTWISIGYNVVGFKDRDFDQAQYTRSGVYLTVRLKFDQQTFRDLGL